ncbi:hypothetical protein D3C87_2090710 [compost metagenome]
MSCSRVRMRTSSGLSAIVLSPTISCRDPGAPSVRGRSALERKSPCPLVTLIMAPEG